MEMDGWMGAPGLPVLPARPPYSAQNKAPLKWMLAAAPLKSRTMLTGHRRTGEHRIIFCPNKKDSMMRCVIFEYLTLNVKWQVIQSDCTAAAAAV